MGRDNWQEVPNRRRRKRWTDLHDVGKEELCVSDRDAEGKFGAL